MAKYEIKDGVPVLVHKTTAATPIVAAKPQPKAKPKAKPQPKAKPKAQPQPTDEVIANAR
jgi:hypothetical protein